VTERIVLWLFGFALGVALAVAVGRALMANHGRKVIPGVCVSAVVLGLLLGWALNGYIDYVRASATMRF
jgi:hypothetical protein